MSAIVGFISGNNRFGVTIKSNIDRCEVGCSHKRIVHSSLRKFWHKYYLPSGSGTLQPPQGKKFKPIIFSQAVFVRLDISVRFADVMVQLLKHNWRENGHGNSTCCQKRICIAVNAKQFPISVVLIMPAPSYSLQTTLAPEGQWILTICFQSIYSDFRK